LLLLSEAIDAYIRHIGVERGVAATTVVNYRQRLRYLPTWMAENGYPSPSIADLPTP
jgi:site-specific recombinase XerC